MNFNSRNVECFAERCNCGGKVCVCVSCDGVWDAHCMDCDHSIHDYFLSKRQQPTTKYKAVFIWNVVNENVI